MQLGGRAGRRVHSQLGGAGGPAGALTACSVRDGTVVRCDDAAQHLRRAAWQWQGAAQPARGAAEEAQWRGTASLTTDGATVPRATQVAELAALAAVESGRRRRRRRSCSSSADGVAMAEAAAAAAAARGRVRRGAWGVRAACAARRPCRKS